MTKNGRTRRGLETIAERQARIRKIRLAVRNRTYRPDMAFVAARLQPELRPTAA